MGPRRRLSPEERRAELVALGAEFFGALPYDEVRIDEIAQRAGVSRALMYHYFPDKKSLFAEVVRAENERLFDLTNAMSAPSESFFAWVRAGVMAYLHYDEKHPQGAWTAYLGVGQTDPVLKGIENLETDRQADRIMAAIDAAAGSALTHDLRRAVHAAVYSWLAFTVEFCRQRVLDSTLDAEVVADSCAHALLDTLRRLPGLPTELVNAMKQRGGTEPDAGGVGP